MEASVFCPLASGSKGNAVLLHTPSATILFDAGLSAKTLREKLLPFNLGIESIDAIVLSHEHQDHIAGLKTLGLRYHIPIIANYATAEAAVEYIGECPKFSIFTTGEPFEFRGIEFRPFSVQHDGADPAAFTVQVGATKIGLCTDIGFVTSSVRHELSGCHILYIEANHQVAMVHASSRPDIYKRRVLSRTGHLSNEEAALLLGEIAHGGIKQVYLAHLSSECNAPDVAIHTVQSWLDRHQLSLPLSVAPQGSSAVPCFFS